MLNGVIDLLGRLIKSSPNSAFSEVDKTFPVGVNDESSMPKTYRLCYDNYNWWPARCCVSSLFVKYKCSFTPQKWFSRSCKVHQTQNEVVRCAVRFENCGWLERNGCAVIEIEWLFFCSCSSRTQWLIPIWCQISLSWRMWHLLAQLSHSTAVVPSYRPATCLLVLQIFKGDIRKQEISR